MENFGYHIAILVALIIGIFLIKKAAGCVFRIIIAVILLGVLGYLLHMLGYV